MAIRKNFFAVIAVIIVFTSQLAVAAECNCISVFMVLKPALANEYSSVE